MSQQVIVLFLQEHALSIFILLVTCFLFYYYFADRKKVFGISKKYQDSIYKTQSKIFLNATHHLISGEKELAIKEFLNAVENNKETIETYLTLGRLFRANGQMDKAINIHRSLIARENIDESQRLESLKELARDFEKGGFLDKAILTYKEVLKVNNEQLEIIKSLCRIFEDLEDWNEALKYRKLLSKVSENNQSEIISHIYAEQAKKLFKEEKYPECLEKLEQSFRYFPSVSSKILQVKLYLVAGKNEEADSILIEMLHEHEMFLEFMFQSIEEFQSSDESLQELYFSRLKRLKKNFLSFEVSDEIEYPQFLLSKLKILEEKGHLDDAYEFYKRILSSEGNIKRNQSLRIEFIKLLVNMDKKEEVLSEAQKLVHSFPVTRNNHFCSNCGHSSEEVFWRCPQCFEWETIRFKTSVS